MDVPSNGGDGRSRGKRSKVKAGRKKRPSGRGRSGHGGNTNTWHPPEIMRDESSILGARTFRPSERPLHSRNGPPDAFQLFCAYHLGITDDDGYQDPRLEDVARRFSLPADEVIALLKKHRLDDHSMRQSRFDLKSARLDIRMAPEGISRTETAREFFQEFLDLN